MKKIVLSLLFSSILIGSAINVKAQRYTSEIFPSYLKNSNVIYGRNIQVLTGSPVAVDLKMDIYRPDGAPDALSNRPLVIVMHTGSFLPPVVNGQPTGTKGDSAVVEMCQQFAKRGYVAAAMDYRLGWNPTATGTAGQDIRTGTLLQAVYRAIQDAKACVRWFRHDVANGNQFGVDTNNIVLGGLGTGGYIALAYATLDQVSEINLPKFLAQATSGSPYFFTAGSSYINQLALGGFEGEGGNPAVNDTALNNIGLSSKINFVFNMGGALGDSSWMNNGDAPMVCFHPVGDPFAPYGNGSVIVPTTGDLVVDVSGSQVVVETANSLGNNNCFVFAGFSDPYTQRANAINGGQEGLFPFELSLQAGPWEWFDSTITVLTAQAVGYPASAGTQAYTNSLLTNPDMSKAKALAYIDTVMNYLNPRVNFCLNLPTSLNENHLTAESVSIQPNPASDYVSIEVKNTNNLIQSVRLFNMLGKEISFTEGLNSNRVIVTRNGLKAGVYIVRLGFENGEIARKVIFR